MHYSIVSPEINVSLSFIIIIIKSSNSFACCAKSTVYITLHVVRNLYIYSHAVVYLVILYEWLVGMSNNCTFSGTWLADNFCTSANR